MFQKLAVTTAIVSLASVSFAQECQSSKTSMTSMQSSKNDIVKVAVEAGSFKTLVKAVTAADLVKTLQGKGPFTVFAPADSAFGKIPEKALGKLIQNKKALTGVLTYHVVPGRFTAKDVLSKKWLTTAQGQSLRVNMEGGQPHIDNARIIKTDIPASNGIIHVIDSVVMPRKNIVQTAVAAGSFKTLATALKAAGLVGALEGKGPFTVFAPTDAAFAKLPKGTVEALLKDIPKLKSILLYHVVPGRVLSTDIKMAKAIEGAQPMPVRAKTLQGAMVEAMRTKSGVKVSGANVAKADIITGNGIIHVIDRVILPPTKQ